MKRYALLIGNARYDDDKFPNLKTPVNDATGLAQLLQDENIGAFDDVKVLSDASMPEMRVAIGEFFSRRHSADDMLLFYFSGHGELDSHRNLYFIGRDTRKGKMLDATGLDASFIRRSMAKTRSQRVVMILDSCFSGAFGGAKAGTQVHTKHIFEGTGFGRFVLTASDELESAWEADRLMVSNIKHSFFTHFLIEGLKSGAADRNSDGFVDIEELYEYIDDGMRSSSSSQKPQKFVYKSNERLFLTRNPMRHTDRIQTKYIVMLEKAEAAKNQGNYHYAEELLNQVMGSADDSFMVNTAQNVMKQVQHERERARAYKNVRNLVQSASALVAQTAWETFTAEYPDYDPDNIGAKFQPDPPPKAAAQPSVGTNELFNPDNAIKAAKSAWSAFTSHYSGDNEQKPAIKFPRASESVSLPFLRETEPDTQESAPAQNASAQPPTRNPVQQQPQQPYASRQAAQIPAPNTPNQSANPFVAPTTEPSARRQYQHYAQAQYPARQVAAVMEVLQKTLSFDDAQRNINREQKMSGKQAKRMIGMGKKIAIAVVSFFMASPLAMTVSENAVYSSLTWLFAFIFFWVVLYFVILNGMGYFFKMSQKPERATGYLKIRPETFSTHLELYHPQHQQPLLVHKTTKMQGKFKKLDIPPVQFHVYYAGTTGTNPKYQTWLSIEPVEVRH